MMVVQQLRPGLWRWTAPHPEWCPEKDKPGGWGQWVGCVYYEAPPAEGGGVILFDPLAPPENRPKAEGFWKALDRDVRRAGGTVTILLGNYFHERSAQAVLERYRGRPGAEIRAPEAARDRLVCRPLRTFAPGDPLPGGVQSFAIRGLESETAYYLPAHRALVFADAVLGAGGGKARVAPLSWAEATPAGQELYKREFRVSLGRLLDLPVDMLLVSHGDPILTNGGDALKAALAAPAWGED